MCEFLVRIWFNSKKSVLSVFFLIHFDLHKFPLLSLKIIMNINYKDYILLQVIVLL